jgi:hypothetical protein
MIVMTEVNKGNLTYRRHVKAGLQRQLLRPRQHYIIVSHVR